MRVKCLAQEHNSVSPARARTRAARSGNERTNYETTDNASNVQCKNRYREQKNKLPAKTYPSPVFLVRKSSDYKTNLHQKMQKGYTIWTESSQRIESQVVQYDNDILSRSILWIYSDIYLFIIYLFFL